MVIVKSPIKYMEKISIPLWPSVCQTADPHWIVGDRTHTVFEIISAKSSHFRSDVIDWFAKSDSCTEVHNLPNAFLIYTFHFVHFKTFRKLNKFNLI